MRADTRTTVAVAIGLVLQLLPWAQLTRHALVLRWAAVGIVAVLLIGWGARRLGLPPLGVVLIQLAAVATTCVGAVWGLHGTAHVLRLPDLVAEGVAFIQGSSAPLSPNPGATLLLVAGATLVALAADGLAIARGRPAGTIAALVALHLVIVFGLRTPTLFGEFVLLALGIALVLLAASPWGDSVRAGTRVAAWLTAMAMTAGAVGATWAISQAMPAFEPRQSAEPLQMNDPSLDLKRNLVQGSDDTVIRYSTDGPGGVYLKLASLPALSPGGFALSDVRVATGRLPAPPGSPPGEPRTTHVEIGEFRSEWLPVPYAPVSFDAPGDWGFALDSLDVMAMAGPERERATEGISYQVHSIDVRPDADTIARAGTGGSPDGDRTTHVPAELSQRVRDLAHQVTASAPTAGAKAQALEAYLRSDRFTYSTAASTGIGDGLATIDDFLFGARTGYCEQFAGAMAIMAREIGIPTRMAVGFVPGEQVGDTWEVSARDLHTWPELWLEGLGWVAFEPTPSRVQSSGEGTPAPAAPTGTATPTTEATEAPTAEPVPAEEQPTEEPTPAPSPAGPGMWPWLGIALTFVALAAAVIAPRVRRVRRRAQRLSGSEDPRADTLAAWDEIREVVGDLRLTWPDGSPRFAAERLVGSLGGDEEAAASLRHLAAATERALYDRSENYDLPGTWADEVGAITGALTHVARERANARPSRTAR